MPPLLTSTASILSLTTSRFHCRDAVARKKMTNSTYQLSQKPNAPLSGSTRSYSSQVRPSAPIAAPPTVSTSSGATLLSRIGTSATLGTRSEPAGRLVLPMAVTSRFPSSGCPTTSDGRALVLGRGAGPRSADDGSGERVERQCDAEKDQARRHQGRELVSGGRVPQTGDHGGDRVAAALHHMPVERVGGVNDHVHRDCLAERAPDAEHRRSDGTAPAERHHDGPDHAPARGSERVG